jgi:hypothetical protein
MLKRVTSLLVSTFLVLGILVALTTKEAHAYIDVASGSFMIQMLVAVALSSLFAVKLFWQRLFSKASRLLSRIKGSHPEAR